MLLIGATMSASATTFFDRTGSLSVHILETGTGTPIEGAELALHQVASFDGTTYALTDEFAESGFDVASIGDLSASENKEQAAVLAGFAADHSLAPLCSETTDADGAVAFGELKLGLFLVVQTNTIENHTQVASFLISIPQLVDERFVFDVDATPKTGTSDFNPPPSPPSPPKPPDLPQTGQLWWPVYAMGGAGLALFVLGWLSKRRKANG